MPSHEDMLSSMNLVHAALIKRYKWFIHTTPEGNIASILENGLKPYGDATAPPEVQAIFKEARVPILCLHPLGAQLCPKGACNSNSPLANQKLVSFAVINTDLPHSVGLDWSYSWDMVLGRLKNYTQSSIEELALQIIQEWGSIVSYDKIASKNLRVFCKSNAPADPMTWEHLSTVKDQDIIFRHD